MIACIPTNIRSGHCSGTSLGSDWGHECPIRRRGIAAQAGTCEEADKCQVFARHHRLDEHKQRLGLFLACISIWWNEKEVPNHECRLINAGVIFTEIPTYTRHKARAHIWSSCKARLSFRFLWTARIRGLKCSSCRLGKTALNCRPSSERRRVWRWKMHVFGLMLARLRRHKNGHNGSGKR